MAEIDRAEGFVAAMLAHPTIEQAAAAAGISESTAYRLLKREDVRLALAEGRREVMRASLTRLQAALGTALDTLERNMGPEAPAAVQVRAAATVLESALRAAELMDLDERLARLEAQQQQQQQDEADHGGLGGFGPAYHRK